MAIDGSPAIRLPGQQRWANGSGGGRGLAGLAAARPKPLAVRSERSGNNQQLRTESQLRDKMVRQC
ncbi:hypothetical protein OsJ_09591 [Oryza sativa Japonica Group]|uniref:Uncharacterized protein n=1 Tax=Oryza sativa subsp. japonica TaxID=39947 RepID=B9FBK6_ORYSJ|nr:hypothetical protein OsJ_09591 [Oryza sativa Japonica Group]